MHGSMKLGRCSPLHHPGVPMFARYTARLPDPPAVIDWSRGIAPGSWGMYRNDDLGDCTAAAAAHAVSVWESYRPPCRFMTDDEVVHLYSATGNYVPGRPETDRGAACLDVLTHWLRVGIGTGGQEDRLIAFCELEPTQRLHLRQALWLFGGVYAGVVLRAAQQTQVKWDLGGDPTIWGGHCVLLVAADDDGLTCVTWGQLKRLTWAWWDAAAEEAFGLISTRWLASGCSPGGIPLAALEADMNILKAG